MYSINFDKWSGGGGRLFRYQRIYIKGRWTPFIRLGWRYRWWQYANMVLSKAWYQVLLPSSRRGHDAKVFLDDVEVKHCVLALLPEPAYLDGYGAVRCMRIGELVITGKPKPMFYWRFGKVRWERLSDEA